MKTNFDLTKPRHCKLILPVPSIIQFVQIQTSFSLLFRLFLLEAKEIRDFSFCPLSSEKTRIHIYSQSPLYKTTTGCPSQPNRGTCCILYNLAGKGRFFCTLQIFNQIISKDFHFLYNMACLETNTIPYSFTLSFSLGLFFQGAFSFCNRCASPSRTEERRRQYLVGGYFAIIIQAMFERATKLRRLT